MVRSNPDSLLLALSKGLNSTDNKVFKVTIKRGGIFKKEQTKAHSRKAQQKVIQQLKQQQNSNQDQIFPLITRVKIANQKQLNCVSKLNKSIELSNSIMGIFRLKFFKEQQKKQQKIQKTISQPLPNSKTSLKKKQRNVRNRERQQKLRKLHQQKSKDLRKQNVRKGENKETTVKMQVE